MSSAPLYLHNADITRLSIDHASRLCIERTQGEPRKIPLHHISRIVCRAQLDISAALLARCMAQGIPISFLDKHGQALGWCMGVRRKECSLNTLLTHALDDCHWHERYRPWLRNMNQAIAMQTLLLCGVPTTPAARHDPRAALCNAHLHKHQQKRAPMVDALGQLARQELAAVLAREAGDPSLIAWRQPGLNLIEELGDLIALHAHTDVHHAPLQPTEAELSAWAVRQYEKHNAHWQQRMGHVLHAFEQFLRSHWL